MKRSVFLLVLLLLLKILTGQPIPNNNKTNENPGVQWVNNLTWEQIKEKAKSEGKYIFLDCFATWCGPCKQMDKNVYPNDTLGNYFNQAFISVKVQFDKTKNDNEQVKQWYKDALIIGSQYRVLAYPSFLFFSPEGKIVHKEIGYKGVNELLKIAAVAIQPGKVYIDPFTEQDRLLEDYRNGKPDYKQMPDIIKYVKGQLGDRKLASQLVESYFGYLGKLKEKKLLTEPNLKFIGNNLTSSNNKFFSLFYDNGNKIDKILNATYFARRVVDSVIAVEYVMPFYYRFFQINGTKKAKLIGKEPDWQMLYDTVAKRFNADYAQRAERKLRYEFYTAMHDGPLALKCLLQRIDNNDLDAYDLWTDLNLNSCSWTIFGSSDDRNAIDTAIDRMRKMIYRLSIKQEYSAAYIDTYAQLLYKSALLFQTNSIDKAIISEEEAVKMAYEYGVKKKSDYFIEKSKQYQEIVDKMKKQELTWPKKK